jgi:hypothetical protein
MRVGLPPCGRRDALVRAVSVVFAAAGALLAPPSALAAYTVVPTGTVAGKQERLAEVQKLFATNPDDPYVFGEKAQLENDIRALETNRAFVRALRRDVADGRRLAAATLTIGVPDLDAAEAFWTKGMGALILRSTAAGGCRRTLVGFGPQSLETEDGAKFALELVETPGSEPAAGQSDSIVQYIQLAMPVFRLSQVRARVHRCSSLVCSDGR